MWGYGAVVNDAVFKEQGDSDALALSSLPALFCNESTSALEKALARLSLRLQGKSSDAASYDIHGENENIKLQSKEHVNIFENCYGGLIRGSE